MENKRAETIVYVDFAREKLQLKQQACCISVQLLSLTLDFLHGRCQVTKVGLE